MVFFKIVFCIFVWIVVAQFLSTFWFAVCDRKEPGCRNINCERAKTCPYSEFYRGE